MAAIRVPLPPPGHMLVLNKFNVVPHHCLVTTRDFRGQVRRARLARPCNSKRRRRGATECHRAMRRRLRRPTLDPVVNHSLRLCLIQALWALLTACRIMKRPCRQTEVISPSFHDARGSRSSLRT
jgi:hypothetical protein